MSEGAVAGYPLQDVKVEVYDGKHHPVDSKEVAFMTAGRKAFIDAIQKAKSGSAGADTCKHGDHGAGRPDRRHLI